MPSADTGAGLHEDILELEPLVKRVAAARVSDPEEVDDVVQETLTRLIEVRSRLSDKTLASYAAVTARNLVISRQRRREIEERHAPQLLDNVVPPTPEEEVLRHEERAAVVAALGALRPRDLDALVDHELHDTPTKSIAKRQGSTPGGVAVRLARARARLRVDYVLNLHRAELPTERCRPVLLALSAGDKRRQRSLGAADHLIGCPTCARLAEEIVRRRRPLAGLLPAVWMERLWRGAKSQLKTPVGQAAAATVVATGLAAGAWLALSDPGPAGGADSGGPRAGLLSVDGRSVFPLPHGDLARYSGRRATARALPVESVPSDEGFWAGPSRRQRVWVEIVTQGESGPHIRPGQRISFTGTFHPTPAAYARRVGVTAREGAAQLTAQGQHLEASAEDIEIE